MKGMEGIRKSQSAMEYLMTYGWAILIIAVVLGALFSLGIFNPAFLAPKVQPGSCQVERPNGPGTSAYISIQGNCHNELPEYVGVFNHKYSIVINTQTSGSGTLAAPLNNQPDFTITAWVNPNNESGMNIYTEGIPSITLQFGIGSNVVNIPSGESSGIGLDEWNLNNQPDNWAGGAVTYTVPPHQWTFVAVTLSNGGVGTGTSTFYVNGQNVGTSSSAQEEYNPGTYFPGTYYFGIGSNTGAYLGGTQTAGSFNGSISNLQIYNASLSPAAIAYLYRAGIGGDPTSLNHLVGWWPLNGNANDYSGNGNNGVNANIIYTNGWTYEYTAP